MSTVNQDDQNMAERAHRGLLASYKTTRSDTRILRELIADGAPVDRPRSRQRA